MSTSTQVQEIHIDGHKLAALPINPGAPGQPVILIHGVMSSIHFWIPEFIQPLLAFGPCYALSLPGHYPASFAPGFSADALTPEFMARTLAAGIRALVGDQPVLLVGHSLGGFSSLAIAALFPEMVTGVVTIGGYPQGRWTGVFGTYQDWARGGSITRSLFKLTGKIGGLSPSFIRAGMRVNAGDVRTFYASPDFPKLFEATYRAAQKLDWDAMLKFFQVTPDADIRSLLPQIRVPVLAIVGDKDPIVPPEQSALIVRLVPHGTLVWIEGAAGHVPMLEYPTEIRLAIQGWLNGLKRHQAESAASV